jgi:secondary thiamine-phosphate synthase enzyme
MIIQKELKTSQKEEIISITYLVEEGLKKANIKEGQVLIFIPHTTAAVIINEDADPDVRSDILKGLKYFKFESVPFDHNEGNSPAHLKAAIFGSSVQVIISGGKLFLGTWQGIYFCEFDGPRARKIIMRFS